MRAAVRVMVLVVVAAVLGITLNRVESGAPVSVPPATPTTPGTPSPPSGSAPIELTRAADGTTVSASVGQTVVVRLPGGSLRWSAAQVQSSDPAAVLQLLSGTSTTDGSSVTRFRVLHGGTATLTATGAPDCTKDTACPQFLLLWRAMVTVPASGAGS
jgi:hypothetical protein